MSRLDDLFDALAELADSRGATKATSTVRSSPPSWPPTAPWLSRPRSAWRPVGAAATLPNRLVSNDVSLEGVDADRAVQLQRLAPSASVVDATVAVARGTGSHRRYLRRRGLGRCYRARPVHGDGQGCRAAPAPAEVGRFTVGVMSDGDLDSTESWAPETCSLPIAERPLRVAEFEELFSSAVLGLDRPKPGRLELALDPTAEVAASMAALMVRETGCCSFFAFTLTATDGRLILEVAVPPTHVTILDELQARAATTMSGGR